MTSWCTTTYRCNALWLAAPVSQSLFVHKSAGGYFRRLGSSKREMTPEVLARLFQERSQSRMIRFWIVRTRPDPS